MFTHLTKSEDKKDNFLRVSQLTEGLVAQSIAYIVRVRRLPDKNGNPYLSFTFRTADKCTIFGRRFRIDSAIDIGDELLKVQKSLVKISYEVQIFKGEYSLIISSIDLITDIDPTPFFDTYEHLDTAYSTLTSAVELIKGRPISPLLKNVSLYSILQGKSGGLIAVFYNAWKILESNANQGFYSDLAQVFFGCVTPYLEYKRVMDKADFVPKATVLDIVKDSMNFEEYRLNSIISDCVSALVGLGEPEHLISHLICTAMTTSESQLNLIERLKVSPKNVPIEIGTKRVLFY